MKIILPLFLQLFICQLCIAQTYSFKPQWKVGESKTMRTEIVEKEYKKGELVSEESEKEEIRFEVIGESDASYTLRLSYKNAALKNAKNILDEEEKENLEEQPPTILIYDINKETAEANLTNWEEARDQFIKGYEKIESFLKQEDDGNTSFFGIIMRPLLSVFESKENMEAYFQKDINNIIQPFGKEYELNKTVSSNTSSENPFKTSETIAATTKTTLASMDSTEMTCIFVVETIVDMSYMKDMMKSLIKKMNESFDTSKRSAKKKMKDIDELEMDMKNTQQYYFNFKTSWVSKIVNTTTVKGYEPGKGKRKNETVSITLIQ